MARDAREQAPPALLGIWKVDAAASTPSSTPQAIQLRSFQYTADGKVLVNFVNISASGKQMVGNWNLQLDGSPGYEYRSDNGSTPIAEIRFTKVDAYTLNLTNSVAGVVESTAVYKLSDDGQTLTMTRSPKKGPQTKTVYKRWDGK